ncbi:MAG TPA: hypothetical protein VM054_10950 [bacterium]|nr:hypothetical protein [bacterium]
MRNRAVALAILLAAALVPLGCADGGFDDGDYVKLTVDLTLLGTRQGPGGSIPSDPALRAQWREGQVQKLLDSYGITEQGYIAYSLKLHENEERYSRVLNDIALELQERNQSIRDEEAPEEVKPPPGSFG